MAIQSNNSTEEVVGSGIKLYSGISNFEILAINPTMKELHALDIKVKQEQNYHVEMNNEDYFKLCFWIKNEDITTRFDIFLQNKEKVSQTGKNQWINNIGQDTWSEEAPTYDWWKSEGEHKAYTGEETLIRFVKAWANVANGDDVYFETMSSIVKGELAEVKELIQVLGQNKVRLLVGVKDDKYQSVYTKYFGRIKPQRDDFFIKALNDEYGSFNSDFNTDLVWGEHKSTAELITADEEKSPIESDDWV
tara:strand:+ start:5258 stop:6004 length:747 start_codon:yes stop_codon:yes gene_type:complete